MAESEPTGTAAPSEPPRRYATSSPRASPSDKNDVPSVRPWAWERRRAGGPARPLLLLLLLLLLNGAPSWPATGFDESRGVLADTRSSADQVRYPEVTQMRPEEVAQPTGTHAPATVTDR